MATSSATSWRDRIGHCMHKRQMIWRASLPADVSNRSSTSLGLLLPIPPWSWIFEATPFSWVIFSADLPALFLGLLEVRLQLLEIDLRGAFFRDLFGLVGDLELDLLVGVFFETVIFLASTSTLLITPISSSAITEATTRPIPRRAAASVSTNLRRFCIGLFLQKQQDESAQPRAAGISGRKRVQGRPAFWQGSRYY